jgi:hypothetical protein
MPPNPVAESDQRSGWKWTILVVLAVVLRAGVLWHDGARLGDDQDNYRRIAKRVVAGDGFVDPDTLTPTAYRPPLYPLLLSVAWRLDPAFPHNLPLAAWSWTLAAIC